jgi:hypothetical protein
MPDAMHGASGFDRIEVVTGAYVHDRLMQKPLCHSLTNGSRITMSTTLTRG